MKIRVGVSSPRKNAHLAANEWRDPSPPPVPLRASIRFFSFLTSILRVVCVTGPTGYPYSLNFVRSSESLSASTDILSHERVIAFPRARRDPAWKEKCPTGDARITTLRDVFALLRSAGLPLLQLRSRLFRSMINPSPPAAFARETLACPLARLLAPLAPLARPHARGRPWPRLCPGLCARTTKLTLGSGKTTPCVCDHTRTTTRLVSLSTPFGLLRGCLRPSSTAKQFNSLGNWKKKNGAISQRSRSRVYEICGFMRAWRSVPRVPAFDAASLRASRDEDLDCSKWSSESSNRRQARLAIGLVG